MARRREIAARYDEALTDIDALERPEVRDGVESGWHLYVVRTRDSGRRKPLFERLRAQGLGVQVHYLPVYWHPYYAGLGYPRGLCPEAEKYYAGAISLPSFPAMGDDDVARVVDVVRAGVRALA